MSALVNACLAWATWHETDEDGDRLAGILSQNTKPDTKKIMVACWMQTSKLLSYHEAGCKAIALKQLFGTGFPYVPFNCQSCGQQIETLDDLTFDVQVWDNEVAA